ncbi:MAG: hypothetical protein DRP84_04365 [Spirochaetes bacterium]|nr:MAG: hypothetical protein DRP84_04365 [Spirochaetota bacterium]
MGKLGFKGILKRKSGKVKDQKVVDVKKDRKKSEKKKGEVPIKDERVLVKKGYARKGDLIATVHPAVLGKEGKNILGEPIPPKEVYQPKLIAGKNVKVEDGTKYFLTTDGIVEVLKDSRGVFYIKGKIYRHGSYKITVSDDEMKAYLTVIPPIGGGRSLNADEIIEDCKKRGIVFGLKEKLIRETVAKAEENREAIRDVVIAEGEEPIDGEDGKLEFKIRLATGNRFKVLNNGKVDFKEQDLITAVEEDELIAVVKKPRSGQRDGHTVLGEKIEAKPGQQVTLEAGKNIRVEDKGDEIHFYAEISGQLIRERNSISIDPLYVIDSDVGAKTGNIGFKGAVLVKGNVNDGFKVQAMGNITIQGNVGKAIVQSKENVIVNNGFAGKHNGLIYAGKDVTIKFAENGTIKAGGNIFISRAALNCKLIAGDRVISVKEKGQIIGGMVKARRGLEAKIIGNELEHKMDIFIGLDYLTEEKLTEIKGKIAKYVQNLKKVELVIGKIKKINENSGMLSESLKKIYTDARKKKALLKIAIDNLKKKEEKCLQSLSQEEGAEIIVHESIYPGVKIYFGDKLYEIDSKKNNVKIVFDTNNQKVRVMPL